MEKFLWVGLGCQQGVSRFEISKAIEWVFTNYNLDLATVAGIATIDRKADERGLVDYCRESGWFLKIYSPERLNVVAIDRLQLAAQHFPALSTLNSQLSTLVGTASVAEAAALRAAESDILLIPKQKFRLDGESGWVTIAVAGASR
jgi:cobalamin biosynthesis protein CbiG